MSTSSNSMFVVRFAHVNAFGPSQTRKKLYDIFCPNKKCDCPWLNKEI